MTLSIILNFIFAIAILIGIAIIYFQYKQILLFEAYIEKLKQKQDLFPTPIKFVSKD